MTLNDKTRKPSRLFIEEPLKKIMVLKKIPCTAAIKKMIVHVFSDGSIGYWDALVEVMENIFH
ncbi:hypothetical protein GCM10009122_50020 [Fulvivirga kasyanovii]